MKVLLIQGVPTHNFAGCGVFVTGDASMAQTLRISLYVDFGGIVHTRLGFLKFTYSRLGTSGPYQLQPYGTIETADTTEIDKFTQEFIEGGAHQNDYIYLLDDDSDIHLSRITEADALEYLQPLNINQGGSGSVEDIAIYRDTLYLAEDLGTTGAVYTLDIRKYRPMSLNTKTRIDVQFIDEGGSLDLTTFAPDAEMFTFATGSDKPTYLSINSSNELEVASSAVTETQPVLVRLTGINRIDSQDFSFYLVIRQAANPAVRDIDELAMYASTTFNLFDIVDNATSITFRSGQTQPTGSSISNGVFTIGTVGGTAYFTATNANGSTNFEIAIDVVSVDPDSFSDTFRYRTEIAGIDVTADVKGTPTVSESIDEVRLNVVTANRVRRYIAK